MKKKILVVEDNDCNRRLVTDILRHFGYTVLQAADGIQALEMTEKNHPDLILMDMQMPIMDGFDCIRALRADEKTAGIKIVAVTSFAMAEEKNRILETGVDKYLAKPIDTRTLPKIVKQMIG